MKNLSLVDLQTVSLSLSPVNCLKTVHPKVSKLISHADSQMVASKRRPTFPWFFGLLPKPFPRVLCKEGWEDGGTCPKTSWLMKGFSYQQQLHIIPFINGMGAAEKARGDAHSVTASKGGIFAGLTCCWWRWFSGEWWSCWAQLLREMVSLKTKAQQAMAVTASSQPLPWRSI